MTANPARNVRTGIIIVAVCALIITAAALLRAWPSYSNTWQEPTGGDAFTPWRYAHKSSERGMDPGWVGLNEALENKDRDAFLAYASGAARESMARWWDNTTQIGWESAFLLPAGEDRVLAGAVLGFPAAAPWGKGNPDAGQHLAHTALYDVGTDGSGEDLTVTSFEPVNPQPWDECRIHVAKRDHVVLYGAAEEKDDIDSQADAAEEDAAAVLKAVDGLNGEAFMSGFTAAVTADPDRYAAWYTNAQAGGWPSSFYTAANEIAGAVSIHRERPPASEATPATVAVRQHQWINGGILTLIGPRALESDAWSYAHEFAHVLHLAARPGTREIPRPTDMEGFARFAVDLAQGTAPRASSQAREEIAKRGTDALIYYHWEGSEQAKHRLGSEISALYFHFLHEAGADPWQVALDLTDAPWGTLSEAADQRDGATSGSSWQEWVAGR